MASVEVRQLYKRYGRIQALQGLDFSVKDGEFFCLLGAPGAGKTTTFRIIAGLEKPDRGEIRIGGELMNAIPPQQRDVAMVFEDVALYPHMSGFDNIAHPLRLRRFPEAEIRQRVSEVAELLRISHLLHRLPHTYSGGERRRVAIARAMIRRPRVLLLDQAFTDLDAKIRQEMAAELKRLQRETGQTMIYATHDFEEAVAMADRILVIRDGRGIQVDEPHALYNRPATTFVASFLGSPGMNLLRCQAIPGPEGTCFSRSEFMLSFPLRLQEEREVILGIRPEHLQIHLNQFPGALEAEVEIIQPLGLERIVDLRIGPLVLKAIVSADLPLRLGQKVWLSWPFEHLFVFDAETEERIYPE
ncbi:MAG TPA: ABC transporter ATP-binding protein [Thermoflexus sp.]|nr:ABC transporter ATP-binding protein [Thermoflexus sp.]